jgi:uncharacterized protein (DUF1499 family)
MAHATAPRQGLARYLGTALALALLLALASALLALGAGPGTRLHWWHFGVGFQVLAWGARVGAAAAVVGLLVAVGGGWLRRWTVLALATLALAMGVAALAVPLTLLHRARSVPPIHDITTDWEHPPAFESLLGLRAGATSPAAYDGAETARLQQQAYPDIRPARFSETPAQVFAAVQRVAGRLGWHVVAAVPEQGRLEATDTTFWFGFTDDVVVRVQAAEGGGARVDIRSKSRVGRSDLGTNAARVRRFLHDLRASGLHEAP